MRKVHSAILFLFFLVSCKKDNELSKQPLHVSMEIDGIRTEQTYTTPSDVSSLFTACGGPDCYVAFEGGFKLESVKSLSMAFGVLHRSFSSSVSFESFKTLFTKGEMLYDGFGATTENNRVEIHYQDENGVV